jgi:hypothetical protein
MLNLLDKIEQILLEWHCIVDGHVWYEKENWHICARCRKVL